MGFKTKAIRRSLIHLRTSLGRDRTVRGNSDEQPLRAELFSVDQLEQQAKVAAGWHEVDTRPGPDLLLPRLAQNEEILLKAYKMVTTAVEANRRIAPAGE
ncbi:MAG: hypothetical protein JXA79_03490, partial [Deltaproteobacteria bacterium]|nr:hypothetical protein [Deltaproteobacteria bacterium]